MWPIAHGERAVRAGRRHEDLDVDVALEPGQRGRALRRELRADTAHLEDVLEQRRELVAGRDAEEPRPLAAVGAAHHGRRDLVDTVLRGELGLGLEVVHLEVQVVVESDELLEQRRGCRGTSRRGRRRAR